MNRSLFFLCILLAFSLQIWGQDSLNMKVLFNWQDASLPDASQGQDPFSYSGGWGLAIEDREYVVMGSSAYIHFFDVTDPANTIEIGRFLGGETTIWREFKTYKNYVYGVSDNTTEGLFIFDLSQAPDTVILVKQDQNIFQSSHTLFIDTLNARLYLNGSNAMSPGSVVLSLANPENPTLLASVELDGGYIHDSYCRDNILYANSGYNGVYIYDMTNPVEPITIASLVTNGFCHSSWLSTDGNTLVNCDEVPVGLPLQIINVSDMNNGNLELVNQFNQSLITQLPDTSPLVTYHNPYMMGNKYALVASYMDGVVIFDIEDPENPLRVAYYDTYPSNVDYVGYGYRGNWGAYPYLPSGNLAVFDIQRGLFMIENQLSTATEMPLLKTEVKIFPNPVTNGVLNFELSQSESLVSYTLTNAAGAKLVQAPIENTSRQIALPANLPLGIYMLHLQTEAGLLVSRFSVAR